MSAVPDLVLTLVWLCLMYEALRSLDSWIKSLVIGHQKWIFRVKSGVQDRYSHRFVRSASSFDSIKRVNMVMNRGQKTVHPLSRKLTPARPLVRGSFIVNRATPHSFS
jgi:hypothetical protein